MAGKSIIIIGAGVTGLAAGSYGQMNGYRTRVLEHDHAPGGVAKAWAHDGYLIDGGIHYLMGHRPGQSCYQIYKELGIFDGRSYPDLTTYVCYRDEIENRQVSFTTDLDRLARELKEVAPQDGRLVDEFMAGVRSLRRTDIFGLMEKPTELLGPLGPLKQLW